MAQPLGLYISVPFCKAKCSFCNFASDAFGAHRMDGYIDRLVQEIGGTRSLHSVKGFEVPREVDTVYFGGGTPSLLQPSHFESIFKAMRTEFSVAVDAEITVEAAPGQIADDVLDALQTHGVNRMSLGVQSFIDGESTAVGRQHTREQCLEEIRRLRGRGINTGIDIICGLPHQTFASWQQTLQDAIASEADHVSVYMFEVDEDSHLGSEVLASGTRYGAGLVPHADAVAEMYLMACEALNAGGVAQYEISNFARTGKQSKHNRRYWERRPYLGFGLDAHSMLLRGDDAFRFANGDEMESYLRGEEVEVDGVSEQEAFEEEVFLRLRMVEGLSLNALGKRYGRERVDHLYSYAESMIESGLLTVEEDRLMLTAKGRPVSSAIFGELLI